MSKCHCGKRASFNIVGETKGQFCKEHKEPNMIDVLNKTCIIYNCKVRPTYNISGETKAHFCKNHKELNMINVVSKRCKINGCNKIPTYNISGKTEGCFCIDHKTSNMINVVSKRCEIAGCLIRPTYNIPGETKARFCVEHKELHMIDIKHNTCEIMECKKRPTYNIPEELNARFCKEHKELNMIDIYNKTCEIDKCTIRSTFNIPGETNARFCAIHKESNMIDVQNKYCQINGCNIRRYYGFLGKVPTHCASHKQKGMITSPTKPCKSCKQLGTHESNGTRFCENHAPVNSDNLGVNPCTSCGLDDILTNGKCNTCDPTTQKIRQHAKENRIKDILEANGIQFIHDKILEGTSCGRERPDFQIDCGSHFVYVEVDEHQHQSYACECEQTRMINLVEVRRIPVRFIRYNPDYYEPIKGQRTVKQEQREKKLIEYIHYAIKHTPQEDNIFANVLYLFYDEYDTTNQQWLQLI